MDNAYPNKLIISSITTALFLMLGTSIHAQECTSKVVDGKTLIYTMVNGIQQTFTPVCQAPDGIGTTVVAAKCVQEEVLPQQAVPKYVSKKQIYTYQCRPGNVCVNGKCAVLPKPQGCFDSDFLGKSDTSTWGSWLDMYNPQIKTSGFVKINTITENPTQFFGDRCKDDMLYEQTCTEAPLTSNFLLKHKEVAVKCPNGYTCKQSPIGLFYDDAAKGEGSPMMAAACVPKPDPCEAPWVDMCSDIEGCQLEPSECPAKTSICDSKLTQEQMQQKYGPNATIFKMTNGVWIANSCISPYTIKHEWCDNGIPKIGTSPCPDGTCTNGLCGGAKILPKDDKPIPDCVDTDPLGKLDVFGTIILKGVPKSDANDSCKTPKIVEQFKCDATNAKGFSGKASTCSGTTDCCDGLCIKPQKASCEEYGNTIPPNEDGQMEPVMFGSVHGVKGKSKLGELFDIKDKCSTNAFMILKAKCDPDSCSGYSTHVEYCPIGKTCKDGACIKNPKSCGVLLNNEGVGVVFEDGKVVEYKNSCKNSLLTTWSCAPDASAQSAITSCSLGCNTDKSCKTPSISGGNCSDTDPFNDQKILGIVTWKVDGQTKTNQDFCDNMGQLVQADCGGESVIYTPPGNCPTSTVCEGGICVFKPQCIMASDCNDNNACTSDSCVANKCEYKPVAIPASSACEKLSCDPAKGIVSTPQNLCPAGQTCDANKVCKQADPCAGKQVDDNNLCTIDACTNGIVTHTPKCLSPNICNPANGFCEKPWGTDKGLSPKTCNEGVNCDDGDVCNGAESCVANVCVAGTPNTTDPKCVDTDKDGIIDIKDGCPLIYNPTQEDINQNGKQDACECALKDQVQITAGSKHTCALLKDGTAQCWGNNYSGKLGNGTTIASATPVAVKGLTNANQITAGDAHTCALLNDGTAQCWGLNFTGQIGTGEQGMNQLTPAAVKDLTNANQITAGIAHTCALLKDGTARCWGYNGYGQLGDGTTTDKAQPVAVKGLINAVQITAGDSHTCALLNDGTAKCWGSNFTGQIGTGEQGMNQLTPAAVKGLTNANQITAGIAHTCALLKDGTAQCWGNNAYNQINANEGGINLFIPATVKDLANAIQITAGSIHTCALLKDGTAQCWGTNQFGQIGIGEEGLKKFTPIAVKGLTNAIQITAGSAHTCALLKDGNSQCWGYGEYGQVGSGTTMNKTVPATVIDGSCAIAIPSCLVKDTYGSAHAGCLGLDNATSLFSNLVCGFNGTPQCSPKSYYYSPPKVSCPAPAQLTDKPKCTTTSSPTDPYSPKDPYSK